MVTEAAKEKQMPAPYTLFRDPFKMERGKFKLPTNADIAAAIAIKNGLDPNNPDAPAASTDTDDDDEEVAVVTKKEIKRSAEYEALIPKRSPLYRPFGNHTTLYEILESGVFAPVMITGLSGNGKTFMTQQVCARQRRAMIRVNFTIETDEDDLMGGFRLKDGKTVFEDGPVLTAMKLGAVLLLDEMDLAHPAKVMCLQSVTEGSGYYVKKTGEYVEPAPGFMVVATGNTKGRGDDTAKFIGTNVLNEAALERFAVVLEQSYPSAKIETNILKKLFASYKIEDADFIATLVKWSEQVRNAYASGAVDEVISTRRLTHIAKMYAIKKDRSDAVKLCLNRFDEHTKTTFFDMFTKLLPTKKDPQADRRSNFQSFGN
jgi:hypothetical protein